MHSANRLRYWLPLLAAVGAIIAGFPKPSWAALRRDWLPLCTLGAIALVPALLGLVTHELGLFAEASAGIALATLFSGAVAGLSVLLIVSGGHSAQISLVWLGGLYLAAWASLLCWDLTEQLTTCAALLAWAGGVVFGGLRLWDRWRRSHHEPAPGQAA
jgi:hypothetical protein